MGGFRAHPHQAAKLEGQGHNFSKLMHKWIADDKCQKGTWELFAQPWQDMMQVCLQRGGSSEWQERQPTNFQSHCSDEKSHWGPPCVHTYTLNKRLIFASRAGEYAQSICSYKNLLKTTCNNRQRLWYFWTIHVQISGNCLKRFWAEGFKRTMSAGLETTLMWRHIRRINFHLTLCTSHCFSSPLRWEPSKDLKDILLTYSRHPSWQLSL